MHRFCALLLIALVTSTTLAAAQDEEPEVQARAEPTDWGVITAIGGGALAAGVGMDVLFFALARDDWFGSLSGGAGEPLIIALFPWLSVGAGLLFLPIGIGGLAGLGTRGSMFLGAAVSAGGGLAFLTTSIALAVSPSAGVANLSNGNSAVMFGVHAGICLGLAIVPLAIALATSDPPTVIAAPVISPEHAGIQIAGVI
jgi:hypothetical protein